MGYEEIDFMSPIIDFVMTYPSLNLVGDVVMLPFAPNLFSGNGLSYSGTTGPSITRSVRGDVEISLQANFVLTLRRNLIDPKSNQIEANFIANFERWVLEKQLTGLTPKFSNFPEGKRDEMFWADNGMMTDVNETSGQINYVDYQIQVHANYKIRYTDEEIENMKG